MAQRQVRLPANPFIGGVPGMGGQLPGALLAGAPMMQEPQTFRPPQPRPPPPMLPQEQSDPNMLTAALLAGAPRQQEGQPKPGMFGMLSDPDVRLALGMGLLSGEDNAGAMANAFGNVIGVRKGQQEQQAAEASRNATADYFRKLGRDDLADLAMQGMAKEAFAMFNADRDYELDQQRLAQAGSGGGMTEYGLTPVYYKDPETGEVRAGTIGKDGSFKPLDAPGNVLTPFETAQQRAEGGALGKLAGALPAKEEAQASLSENLTGLAQIYLKLDELGGIVNPDRGTMSNIGARLSASDAGQMVGGAVGTEAQSLRERIVNMRPLLVQTIRQATGMSARGMDSNRELEFYLQAATKPTGDIYSNLAAIEVLDRTFGMGGVLQNTLPPDIYQRVTQQAQADMSRRPIRVTPGQIEATVTSNPETIQGDQVVPGQVLDGYRFLGGDPADPNSWQKVQ